jgi:hypothetical protein
MLGSSISLGDLHRHLQYGYAFGSPLPTRNVRVEHIIQEGASLEGNDYGLLDLEQSIKNAELMDRKDVGLASVMD